MNKRNQHSDSNLMGGIGAWLLFDRIAKTKTFKDFLESRTFNDEIKEDAFKVLRMFSFSVIVESRLIDRMYKQFESFGAMEKNKVKKEILKKIERNHRLRGTNAKTEAKRILEEQLSSSQKIIIPPVLQYAAGYSMGGLIAFARTYFNISNKILIKLDDFKDRRNYLFHNSTSSRDNIDQVMEEALEMGEELMNLLK